MIIMLMILHAVKHTTTYIHACIYTYILNSTGASWAEAAAAPNNQHMFSPPLAAVVRDGAQEEKINKKIV